MPQALTPAQMYGYGPPRFIQIATADRSVYALTKDGQLWECVKNPGLEASRWQPVPFFHPELAPSPPAEDLGRRNRHLVKVLEDVAGLIPPKPPCTLDHWDGPCSACEKDAPLQEIRELVQTALQS